MYKKKQIKNDQQNPDTQFKICFKFQVSDYSS